MSADTNTYALKLKNPFNTNMQRLRSALDEGKRQEDAALKTSTKLRNRISFGQEISNKIDDLNQNESPLGKDYVLKKHAEFLEEKNKYKIGGGRRRTHRNKRRTKKTQKKQKRTRRR